MSKKPKNLLFCLMEAINLAKNNLASTSKNLDIKKYTKVVGVFGGMDAEANFYNDLMVWKIE